MKRSWWAIVRNDRIIGAEDSALEAVRKAEDYQSRIFTIFRHVALYKWKSEVGEIELEVVKVEETDV